MRNLLQNQTRSLASANAYAARLTPEVPAAIATIAVRGAGAVDLVQPFVSFAIARVNPHETRFGTWSLGGNKAEDRATSQLEQIVLVRLEDKHLELHCHGGPAVCHAILQDLASVGCSIVNGNDWLAHDAVREPHLSSIQRAAQQDLLKVTSSKAAAVLLDQYQGAMGNELSIVLELIESGATAKGREMLLEFAHFANLGLHLIHPWRIALAGPPNAGKSSLINRMVGQQAAIVHAEAGTTRDWVEAQTEVAGWPVSITDTAGIRSSQNEIESAGVKRALERVRLADLLFLVVDAQNGWTKTHTELLNEHRSIAESTGQQAAIIYNKIDLPDTLKLSQQIDLPAIATCCLEREKLEAEEADDGISEVLSTIRQLLIPNEPMPGKAIPFRTEQVVVLNDAIELLSGDPADGLQARELLKSLLL